MDDELKELQDRILHEEQEYKEHLQEQENERLALMQKREEVHQVMKIFICTVISLNIVALIGLISEPLYGASAGVGMIGTLLVYSIVLSILPYWENRKMKSQSAENNISA